MNDSSPTLPYPAVPDSLPPPGLAAYILAGGQSRRFGEDKAMVVIDGQPQLVRLADDLRSLGCRVSVVTSRPGAYRQLGLRTVVDRRPGLGPLAGLERALEDAQSPEGALRWALVLACDTLELPSRWLTALCRPLLWPEPNRRSPIGPSDVAVQVYLFAAASDALPADGGLPPRVGGPSAPALIRAAPGWQPFPGLYAVTLLPAVRDALAAADRSLQRLLGGEGLLVEQIPSPVGTLATANTPDQLRGWLEARSGPAHRR
jgi:molybdopterin-guanine dinucleotide biosynthesis protein A